MKLRQKLAMVLAAAMVVTAVPVVTMAYTTNSVNTDVNIVSGEKVNTFTTFTLTNNFDTTAQNQTVEVTSPSVKKAVMGTSAFAQTAEVQSATTTAAPAETAALQGNDSYTLWKEAPATSNNTPIIGKYYWDGTTYVLDLVPSSRVLNDAGRAKLAADIKGNPTVEAAVKVAVEKAYDENAANANTAIGALAAAEVTKQNASITPRQESITYIDITNAEFEVADYPSATPVDVKVIPASGSAAYTAGKVERMSKTQLRVTLKGQFKRDDQVIVPLNFKAKEGEIKLTIDGTDAAVSDSTHIITEKSTKYMTSITAGDAKTVSEKGGKIADITLTESMIGTLNKMDGNIKLELPTSSELEFKETNDVTVNGKKAYAGIYQKNADGSTKLDAAGDPVKHIVPVKFGTDDKGKLDRQVLIIDVQSIQKTFVDAGVNSIGSLTFEGIQVVPQNRKDVKFGDVEVNISSTIKEDKNTTKIESEFETVKGVKVAKVADYDVALTCAKPAEIVAGKDKKEVSFNLTEAIAGSLHTNKLVDFTLDNGFFGIVDPSSATAEKDAKELLGNILKKDAKGDVITDVDFYDVEIEKDGRVTGFTLDVSKLDAAKTHDLFFTVEVQAPVQFSGDINLLVKDGGVDHKDLKVKIATVAAPYKVTTDAMTVKVGLKEQTGGKIVIEETAGNTLRKGEIEIFVEDGFAFEKGQDLKVETTGDLKVTVDEVKKESIVLDVTRTSDKKTPASITISDIIFDINRMIPEGKFDIQLTGEAFTDVKTYEKEKNTYTQTKADLWTVGDFLVVNTPNTEDITNSGMKVGTASFTNGVAKFVSNGVEKEMNGTPYISKNNRMMVPFRYVGEAFGIDGNNIIFSNSTVTMLAGTRTIQLTNGSDVALLNGAPVKMEEAMIIKEDRTYIPIGEVAKLLGVKTSWDNDTKTATFSNEK